MSVRDLHRLDAVQADVGAPPITCAYVSAYRDEDAIESALTLRHYLDSAVPMVVVLSRTDGVARLITDATAGGELTNVNVFPALERTCTAELVAGGIIREDRGRHPPPLARRATRRRQGRAVVVRAGRVAQGVQSSSSPRHAGQAAQHRVHHRAAA